MLPIAVLLAEAPFSQPQGEGWDAEKTNWGLLNTRGLCNIFVTRMLLFTVYLLSRLALGMRFFGKN